MADYYVYAYIDPRNDEPFYIGAGHGKRAKCHLTACKCEPHAGYNRFFYRKLRKLLKSGVNPAIRFIAKNLTQGEAFKIWEPFFICALGRRDIKTGRLCNHTDGGEGVNNLSPEVRARMSSAKRKYYEDPEANACKSTPEARARMSAAAKERCADPKVRARMSAAAKERCADPKVRACLATASKEYWADPEARARQSIAAKERCVDPEVKARMSTGQKKRYEDPEARERQSAIQRGRHRPPQKGRRFKGVSRDRGKYKAVISTDRKRKHLGTCDTAEEAAKLYNDAVDLYWGGDGWKNPV